MLQVSDEMWRHTHTRAQSKHVQARIHSGQVCVYAWVALTACSGAESVARCECEGTFDGYLNRRPSQWHKINCLPFPVSFPLSILFHFCFFIPRFNPMHVHTSQKTHQDAVISTVDGIITQIMICVSICRVHRRCRNLSPGSNYRPSSITPATV